ncbi:MAG TPA: NAD(P)H-binding protein [Steroidobacter sp.]
MVVLLTGATGFIGRHLSGALKAAGHVVIEARRGAVEGPGVVQADFTRDVSPGQWVKKLDGVEAVINAVGILRERGEQTFERIHTRAPQALFAACAQAGVRRIIQISALGARTGRSAYFTSKRAADDALMALPVAWTIVEPSLVYGPGGTSARLFSMMASTPVIGLPGKGRQPVQPIHVDDLTQAIVALLTSEEFIGQRVPLVGPEPLALRDFLAQLREAMGAGRPPYFEIPMPLMRTAARIAELSPRSLLDRDTLEMLESGNVADPALTTKLLGRPPRSAAQFIEPSSRAATLAHARLQWLLPLLRLSIAIVWLWTALVSFGLFSREASYELLARAGVPPALAPAFLFSAAALNLVLGIATLAMQRRHVLWLVQMVLIGVYTLIISVRLPEFWLHPYGPVLKNLPMLAALYLLYSLEPRR